MKARLVYRNVRNATWIVKRHLAIRSGVKWARRGYYHIEILLSSHGVGKKNLEGLLWGWKAREPLSMYMLGQGPNPRKNPSSTRQGWGQREWSAIKSDTLNHSMEKDKYQERKGQRKAWKYLRKSCYCRIKCSATKLNRAFQPLQPLRKTLGRGWWDKYQHYQSKSKCGWWKWEEDNIK